MNKSEIDKKTWEMLGLPLTFFLVGWVLSKFGSWLNIGNGIADVILLSISLVWIIYLVKKGVIQYDKDNRWKN